MLLFILTIVRRTKHNMWRKFRCFYNMLFELETKPVVQLCVRLISRISHDSSSGTNIKNSTVDQEF